MNVPDDLRYSTDHEWARLEDGQVRVGITDYAQDTLGDVVFVQLPEAGTRVEAGRHLRRGRVHQVGVRPLRPRRRHGGARSTPSWSTRPNRLNEDPYGEGWICVIEPDDAGQLDALLDAGGYGSLIEG